MNIVSFQDMHVGLQRWERRVGGWMITLSSSDGGGSVGANNEEIIL